MEYFENEMGGVQLTLTQEPALMPNGIMQIMGVDSKGKTYEYCINKKDYHMGDVISFYGPIVFGDILPIKVRKVK